MSIKKVAVIAGDGIGKEVMPEGIRVMEAVADKFGKFDTVCEPASRAACAGHHCPGGAV